MISSVVPRNRPLTKRAYGMSLRLRHRWSWARPGTVWLATRLPGRGSHLEEWTRLAASALVSGPQPTGFAIGCRAPAAGTGARPASARSTAAPSAMGGDLLTARLSARAPGG